VARASSRRLLFRSRRRHVDAAPQPTIVFSSPVAGIDLPEETEGAMLARAIAKFLNGLAVPE
jgi:hypothetical protein